MPIPVRGTYETWVVQGDPTEAPGLRQSTGTTQQTLSLVVTKATGAIDDGHRRGRRTQSGLRVRSYWGCKEVSIKDPAELAREIKNRIDETDMVLDWVRERGFPIEGNNCVAHRSDHVDVYFDIEQPRACHGEHQEYSPLHTL